MRFILILLLAGCASVSNNLEPTKIYTLEDGSKIKVYQTQDEKIYIRDSKFDVIQK